jgi:putative flippase GtrA
MFFAASHHATTLVVALRVDQRAVHETLVRYEGAVTKDAEYDPDLPSSTVAPGPAESDHRRRASPARLGMSWTHENATKAASSVALMQVSLGKIIEWTKSHQGRKLIRFTSVSVVSTAVSILTISLVYGFKIIRGEVEATLFGNLMGAIPSYTLNRRWTWGKTGRSHLRGEILPFAVMSALGISFSMVGGAYARHLVHTHRWSHLFNTGIVDAANLASFALFWVLKLVVFNRIFRVDEEAEIDAHLVREETPPGN